MDDFLLIAIHKIGAIKVSVLKGPLEDFGEWDSDSNEIRLKQDTGLRNEGLTHLHELIHAVTDTYGLDLPESTVRLLETAIGTFIQDNKSDVLKLIEKITSD